MTSAVRLVAGTVALLAVLAGWGLLLAAYPKLPTTLPTHFGLDGRPTQFGPKATVFAPAVIATLLCAALLASTRFSMGRPSFPVTISAEQLPRAMDLLHAFVAAQAAIAALVLFAVEWLMIAAGSRSPESALGLALSTVAAEAVVCALFYAALAPLRA